MQYVVCDNEGFSPLCIVVLYVTRGQAQGRHVSSASIIPSLSDNGITPGNTASILIFGTIQDIFAFIVTSPD